MHPTKHAIACVMAIVAAPGCTQADPSQVNFVREVYQDEVRAFTTPMPGTPADFNSLLSRPTQELLRAAKAGPGPKFDGPILHAFFGWQVTPVSKVALKDVAASRSWRDRGKVSVGLEVNGAARQITVTVSEDCWAGSATVQYCIEDFRYENGTSYREHLSSLAER